MLGLTTNIFQCKLGRVLKPEMGGSVDKLITSLMRGQPEMGGGGICIREQAIT